MINELATKAYQNSVDKGFYEKEKNIGEMIALMHSELSEALEADRKGKYCNNMYVTVKELLKETDDEMFIEHYKGFVKGTFEEEMADVVIRVFDMCGFKKIDLEQHILAKMRYNASREKYHGKKY